MEGEEKPEAEPSQAPIEEEPGAEEPAEAPEQPAEPVDVEVVPPEEPPEAQPEVVNVEDAGVTVEAAIEPPADIPTEEEKPAKLQSGLASLKKKGGLPDIVSSCWANFHAGHLAWPIYISF